MDRKSVKFYTLGCKVNQYETQLIREQFIGKGFGELENCQPADIYVINTCTVTRRADSDSVGLMRKAKRENPKAKIIVTGCMASLDRDRIKGVDKRIIIVDNENKSSLLECLRIKNEGGIRAGISYFKGHTRAFLKIQDGCDNFCSYCKVPLVRGACKSKPLSEIVREAKELAGNGVKELVLSGICLGSYGRDLRSSVKLVDVVCALQKIDKLLRIRLSSIEAGDVSDELIQMMAQSKKLCRHLHIPIQSGDDGILRKMNRKYTGSDYLGLINKIKNKIPGVAVTTDCIVGFPGETEVNFQNTLDLIKKITPLKVHAFPYSKREGTFAAKNYNNDIGVTTMRERIRRLKDIAQKCSFIYRKQFLNNYLEALIEGRSKVRPCFWEGLTGNYIRVFVKSKDNLKNQPVSVKIKKMNKDFCEGQIL